MSSSSPYREVEISDAQKAFQKIVGVVTIHEEKCKAMPKRDVTKEIELIATEIIKSKIRDKLLLASKEDIADVNAKFEQMKINNMKKEGSLSNLKQQVLSQTKSISNQAKLLDNLIEKSEKLESENNELKTRVDKQEKEIDEQKKEIQIWKRENEKLRQKNDALTAQINEILK